MTKLKWKAADAATRGPPPFKGPLPEAKLANLAMALGKELGSLPEAEAKRKAELTATGLETYVQTLRATMDDAARALEADVIAEDTAAVAAAKAELGMA